LNYETKKNKRRPGLLVWTLSLSLGAHALFFVFKFSPIRHEPAVDTSTPIEITEVPKEYLKETKPAPQKKAPPKPSKEIEMAETEDADNKELDPNAKFLSDRNQTAKEQTKAKSIDDFRKKQGSGLKAEKSIARPPVPTTGNPNQETAPTESEVVENPIDAVVKPEGKGVKRDWKTLTLKDLGVGGDGGATASTDDRLNGVEDGERTILSTREYRYFSYYHRIKELLRQYWKPTVERKLYKLWEKGKSVSEEEMVTRVLVLLNPEGKIEKISRVTSSGFGELDEAAIEAFHRAGPFPNPPRGIIDDDGFVRIRWDFILKTESAPRIQFSNAGGGGSGPRGRSADR